jgi:uncharacterized protein with NRDE domain
VCLLMVAVGQHPDWPLVLAANRDEFHRRPTAHAAFWGDAPHVLAGRDLEGGGTWMGVTRSGHVAALTNYRDPARMRRDAPSRGMLVGDYLRNPPGDADQVERLQQTAAEHNGYNLLFGRVDSLLVFSNVDGRIHSLGPGIHGLSNHLLNSPWPKVERARQGIDEVLTDPGDDPVDRLMALLADRTPAPDASLPDTGVGLAAERALSPIFLQIPAMGYGTRSSTVVLVDGRRNLTFVEERFDDAGRPAGRERFTFAV